MNWNIVVYESARGEKPVEEFIKSLDDSTIAKVSHLIDLLEKYGSLLSMPHTKKLTRVIYELRIRGKVEIRILYTFIRLNIYLLHAFKKKTQRTPLREIKTAEIRLSLLTDI